MKNFNDDFQIDETLEIKIENEVTNLIADSLKDFEKNYGAEGKAFAIQAFRRCVGVLVQYSKK